MLNIHCSLTWKNLFWFIRYLRKSFKKEVINLEISTNSKKIVQIILGKFKKKRNLYSLKLNINSRLLTEKILCNINTFCKGEVIFLLDVDFCSKIFSNTEIIAGIKFPCLASNYINKDKYGMFIINDNKEKILLNALFIHYDYPFINCEFTSCVCKNIWIKNKKCSVCKLVEMDKYITSDNINDIFLNNDDLTDKLKKIVLKRSNCKNNCTYYSFCKGGCLYNNEYCHENEIQEAVRKIANYLDNSNLMKEMLIKYATKKH